MYGCLSTKALEAHVRTKFFASFVHKMCRFTCAVLVILLVYASNVMTGRVVEFSLNMPLVR